MNAGCVFLCFLLLMQVCPSQFSGSALLRPDVVNIGALFPLDSTVGRVARMAIGEAVKDVNADPNILVGTKLVLKMQNSNCSPFIAMASAMQFMEDDVVAIIGPQSSVVAHVISYVVKEHQVPLLSFAATDPSLSPLQFPFFVRTVPSDRYPMAAIADMVNYYGWREVIAIYVDDDFGRNGVAALDDVLGEKRCRVSYKMGIAPSPGAAGQDSMNDILIKIAVLESRVIILHLNPDSGLKLLSAASHLGMIGNGYVWIATDWLSSLLDSPPPRFPSHGMAARSMEGVLSLRLHIPDSTAKRAFVSRWKKVTGGGGSLGLNAYGLYAYDTVWLLGRAMDAFLKKNGTISFSTGTKVRSLHTGSLHLEATNVFDQGRDVLQNILRTEFTGLTGQVAFDADRSRVSPCFDIINVVGGGYRRVGYWSNGSGLSTVRPDGRLANRAERLGSVIWPGGTGATPRGWVFPNNGKRLRIGVPRRVSFKEFVSEARGTETFKGFCIDVFSAAVSLLPYAVPYQFIPYGDDRRNPSYSELVNLINAGVFDAAVGDISIVMNRTKYVDFTQPYIASGLVVVAPFKQMNSGAWAFLRPFSPLMWCITAGFFLVIGLVVWILEHRINDDFRGPPRKQFVTILCFSFSTLFFAHRENMMSALGRLVLIVWLFVVLIINSSYTASLTSLLTVQQLFSPFESIESLKESGERVGFQVGSFTEYYLEEIGIPRSKLVALGSPEEYAAALLRGSGNGGVAAVVDELPYADIFLSNQCNFKVVGREFTRSGWGFAFPRDSPVAADLSTAILSLSEEGDLQRIHDKWLVKNACSMDGAEIRSDRLHLTSFEGLFVICALSCLAALVVHFSHIIFQFRRAAVPTSTSRSGSTASSHSKSLKRFLSMMDEKEEDFKSRGKEHDDHCRDDDDERKPKRRHKI